MPRVPTYDTPTAQPGELPGARYDDPRRSLNESVAITEQNGAIGKEMQGAGNQWAAIVQQEQAEKNEADAKNAHAQLQSAYNDALYKEGSGYLYQQGQNAVEGKQDVLDSLQKTRAELADSIVNPRAKALFNQQADITQNAYANQVESHAGREHQTYMLDASKLRSQAAGQAAAISFNPMPGADNSVHAAAIATVEKEAEDRGANILGLRGEDLTNYVKQEAAPVYAEVVRHLADNNQSTAAKAYLDAHRDDIPDPNVQDTLSKLVKNSETKGDAALLAISVKHQINGLDKQEKFLDDQLVAGKITPEIHAGALAHLRSDDAQRREQQSEADKQFIGNIWAVKQQNPNATLQDLTPSQITYIKARGLGASVDSILNHKEDIDDSAVYADLMRQASDDPQTFSSMDLPKMSGQLTKGHYTQLVERQAAINKGDLKAQQITNLQNTAVKNAMADIKASGLVPAAKPGTTQADQFAKFESSLQDALTTEQQSRALARKPPLTADEAKAIAQGLVKQQALAGTGLWGMFQTKGRTYELASDIPQAERDQISAKLRSAGMTPTPQNIVTYYNRSKGAK